MKSYYWWFHSTSVPSVFYQPRLNHLRILRLLLLDSTASCKDSGSQQVPPVHSIKNIRCSFGSHHASSRHGTIVPRSVCGIHLPWCLIRPINMPFLSIQRQGGRFSFAVSSCLRRNFLNFLTRGSLLRNRNHTRHQRHCVCFIAI